jgi:SAM-dependent methyltransferase
LKGEYRPKEYWEHRFSINLDLTTVGSIGLGYVYNHWLYRARFHAVHRALRKLNLDISRKLLLDIGVGSGAWIRFWQQHSVLKIVGLDITTTSIRALTNKYPEFDFIQGNISDSFPFNKSENFDIATAFDILFHITDNKEFSRAIANISKCVRKGGWIFISDSFCDSSQGPFYHDYYRSYDEYLEEFNMTSLKVVHIEPIFFTMTTPICNYNHGSKRLLSQFSRVTLRLVNMLSSNHQTELINHLIGCSLYLLDDILCRILKTGPSLKILFAKKC